jgi:predicted RND superfamily exporter protein
MPKVCLELSLLELWANDGKYDERTDREIASLTKQSILDKINNFNKSGVYLIERNFSSFLGGVKYDSSGRIVEAESTIIRWFVKMNATEALLNPLVERDEAVDIRTLEFEGAMLEIMLNNTDHPPGLQSFPNVQRSFADVATVAVLGDITQLFIGYMIVFVYVMIMLGKFSCVEQRAYLSMASITGIVMGIVVSYGFCSGVGLFYGPMHNVLPFLLLGIGIDDMFVIVQSWDTLTEKEKANGSMQHKFGKTLSHSGVAITITSLTDVLAFAIGGTTVLPALKSFCLYASVGIVAIYWFQCTFFVAWMSIDQRRIEKRRNGCCPCYVHNNTNDNGDNNSQNENNENNDNNDSNDNNSQNVFANKSFSRSAFIWYGNILMKTLSKIVVCILTVILTGVAIAGNVLLEQNFDPAWFLPPDTYLAQWFQMNRKYFPFGGDRVTIWCHGLDYQNELEKLDDLAKRLSDQKDIIDNVDSWSTHFLDYLKKMNLPKTNKNETLFKENITQFFYSPRGSKYRQQFKFKSDPICGQKCPDILLSDITFYHKIFKGPSEQIPAMNRVKRIIKESNLTGRVFPMSLGYAAWETDEVIAEELYRNLGLAVVCIFATTVVLIGQMVCSVLVLLMVILSLAEVGGFMHFWGLTIDTVSCINLIIAMGLCVDYSAHVAHRYKKHSL